MKYRTQFKINGKMEEGTIHREKGYALTDAREALARGASFAAILCDTEGADHPANAGKFFLEQFVKA